MIETPTSGRKVWDDVQKLPQPSTRADSSDLAFNPYRFIGIGALE